MANETPTPTSSIELIGLQGQLDGVRSELVSTNNGLIGIANLIRTDSAQDQQRLLEEKRDQQILSERQVRIGQEEELERKVSTSFVEPVNKLERNLQKSFLNVENALKLLFTGVFAGAVVTNLDKISNVGKKTFSGIQDVLKKAFDFISGGLSTITDGFGFVANSIGGIADGIKEKITALIKSPIKFISDTFKKLLGLDDKDENPPPASILPPPQDTQQKADLSVPFVGPINVPEPIKSTFTGISNFASSALSGITGGIQSLTSGTNISNINIDDTIKGIQNAFTSFSSSLINPNQTTETAPATPPPATATVSATPSPVGVGYTIFGKQRYSLKPDGTLTFPKDGRTKPTPEELKAPDQKPDVVLLSNNNQQQPPPVVSSGETKTLTDVPLIASANPDNFYTLYAQVNYNVVM